MSASRPPYRRARVGNSGMTMVEMISAIVLVAIAGAMSFGSFFQYQQSVSTSRAARVIGADVQLTRSLAIRARAPVSLVVDESQLDYVIRDTLGTRYMERAFDSSSQLPLSALTISTPGDSLTFDARGILLSAGTPVVSVSRQSKVRTVSINALGRTQVN